MKGIISIIACLLFAVSVNAQTANGSQSKSATSTQAAKPAAHAKAIDCVKMVNGIVLLVKNGVTTTMSVQLMLKNGTVINTDGSILTKAGKKLKLKNGQKIDMKGRITSI